MQLHYHYCVTFIAFPQGSDNDESTCDQHIGLDMAWPCWVKNAKCRLSGFPWGTKRVLQHGFNHHLTPGMAAVGQSCGSCVEVRGGVDGCWHLTDRHLALLRVPSDASPFRCLPKQTLDNVNLDEAKPLELINRVPQKPGLFSPQDGRWMMDSWTLISWSKMVKQIQMIEAARNARF